MSDIGICEYVIGVIHDNETWYWVGDRYPGGKPIALRDQFSSSLDDARRYDDILDLRDDLELLPPSVTRKILEINRCPKCGKEFTEYPALSREDNETEICPGCGVRESVEAYVASQGLEIED